MGKLFGGKPQQTSSSQKPWEPAIPVLEKILANADKLFDEKGGINAEFVNKEIADLTPEMQQSVKDMIASPGFKDLSNNLMDASKAGAAGVGQAQDFLKDFASGKGAITADQINNLAKDLYQGDVVQSQVDQLSANVKDALGGEIQGLNQAASAGGSMGSSRAGVAEGVAKGKAAEAIATGSAQLQDAALQRAQQQAIGTLAGNVQNQLGATGQLGQLGLGSAGLGSLAGNLGQQGLQNQMTGAGILQNWAQSQKDVDWFNKTGQQQAGWQNLGNLLGMAGPIGGMGGTGTGTGQGGGGSMFNQMLGGASSIMGGLGAMGYSDASLKKKVKKISKEGEESKYKWEWNDSAEKKLGLKGKASGVLAQQVSKESPEKVSRDLKSGKLMVDYSKIGK